MIIEYFEFSSEDTIIEVSGIFCRTTHWISLQDMVLLLRKQALVPVGILMLEVVRFARKGI